MGIRLYPTFGDVVCEHAFYAREFEVPVREVLEAIRRLAMWNALEETCETTVRDKVVRLKDRTIIDNEVVVTDYGIDRAGFVLFCLRRDMDPLADKIHSFRLFGWGKRTEGCDGVCGHAVGDEAQEILRLNNIQISPSQFLLLKGVHWG